MYCKNIIYLIIIVLLYSCSEKEARQIVVDYSCSQCPVILENQDTLAFINEVRNFVASNADIGNVHNSLCDTFYKIPIEKFDVDTFLQIFKEDKGTATCGLSAQMMVKILMENGIDAYTYNFGFENTVFNHVLLLVEYKNRLIVQDPHYNSYLVDSFGVLANFTDVLSKDNRNKLGKFEFVSDTIETDFIIDYNSFKKQDRQSLSLDCQTSYDLVAKEFNSNNNYKQRQDIYFGYKVLNCFSFIDSFENELEKNGFNRSFVNGLNLKMNKIDGSKDHELLNTTIDSLLAL